MKLLITKTLLAIPIISGISTVRRDTGKNLVGNMAHPRLARAALLRSTNLSDTDHGLEGTVLRWRSMDWPPNPLLRSSFDLHESLLSPRTETSTVSRLIRITLLVSDARKRARPNLREPGAIRRSGSLVIAIKRADRSRSSLVPLSYVNPL